MSCLGNLLWLIFAGFWQALGWFLAGILWSITIVGIPIGQQCFKMARFMIAPFGIDVDLGGGPGSIFLNVFWIIFSGFPLATAAVANGVALCLTIIGIPFGLQCFKFVKLALFPFGSKIINIE